MTALPKLGTTLYSFTPEFHAYKYSTADLIRTVADAGIGPGLELVGFQSIPGFPEVSPEFEREFKDLIAETGLEPSCLAANVDAGIRRDRVLTQDELVEYMGRQIEAARILGFPVVRMQYLATPDLMEALVPLAERADVTLGMELHAPETVHTPVMTALRERYERLQSPRLGFIPDFGASTVRLPESLISEYRARGVGEDVIDLARRTYESGERADFLMDLMAERGESVAARLFVQGVGLFGHQKAEDWAEIAPWIVHVHGKFYDIDDTGDEPVVPHAEILEVLVRSGYTGYISSEWEAWHWVSEPDAKNMIVRHHALQRRILDTLSAAPAGL